jgi:hypothetical protein
LLRGIFVLLFFRRAYPKSYYLPVHKKNHNDTIPAGRRRRFGRSKNAAVNSAHDDHGHYQGKNGAPKSPPDFLQLKAAALIGNKLKENLLDFKFNRSKNKWKETVN